MAFLSRHRKPIRRRPEQNRWDWRLWRARHVGSRDGRAGYPHLNDESAVEWDSLKKQAQRHLHAHAAMWREHLAGIRTQWERISRHNRVLQQLMAQAEHEASMVAA